MEADQKRLLRKLRRTKPPEDKRVAHGQWAKLAAVVQRLVETGWNVSAAVRAVIAEAGIDEGPQARKAFAGIRAAYYVSERRRIRDEAKGEFVL